MKQRLGLALALVHNPKLLILDEPTNGLDPVGVKNIMNMIRNMTNTTVLISSHMLSEIEEVMSGQKFLTDEEKYILADVIDLHNKHLQNNDGNDDDWNTRKIISYAQGYTISRANAVLNVLIIKVIEKEN